MDNNNPVLNEKWLKHASWVVNHRDQVRLLLIGIVIFIDGVLLIFSTYGWLDWLVLSRGRDQRMYQEISRPASILALHNRIGPKPLEQPLIVILGGSRHEGKYDALVKFVNPNSGWVANVKFKVAGDSESPSQSITILNNEERFWLAPAVSASPSSVPQIIIENVDWEPLRDVAAFNALKPTFAISGVAYEPISNGEGQANRVTFTALNDSPIDWWRVEFMIIVRQGSQEMAAQNISVSQFKAGTSREVAANFYGPIGSGASAVVIPFVNVADPGAIMKTQLNQGL
jgi:hypothetical protein